MRTLVSAALLAACQSGSSPSQQPAAIVPDPYDPWSVTPTWPDAGAWNTPLDATRVEMPKTLAITHSNEPIVESTPRHVVASMHSGSITMLAVTDDGRAAVTTDFGRTARVWPTLDGKHEPVVVAMRPPSGLALARDGERLVIGALDAAGQLELIETTTSGESVRRVAIEAMRPYVAIHAVPRGFLTLTDDRAVFRVALDGTVSTGLVADPEQHVVSIAVRGERALALIDQDGKVRGRWLDLATGEPQWGTVTPVLPFAGEHVAISPDGTRAAGIARRGKRVVIASLANGKQIARALDRDFEDPQLRAIGFLEDNALAITSSDQRIAWWNKTLSEPPSSFTEGVVVVAGNTAISASGGSLVLSKPGENPAFLGYRMGGPQKLHSKGEHFLLTDTMSLVEVDEHFHTHKVHGLPEVLSERGWYDLRVVDTTHVVAATYTGSGYAIYLLDLVASKATLVAVDGFAIDYQPSTQLLGYRTQKTIEVVKLDRETNTFGQPAVIQIAERSSPAFVLLDPALAKGNIAAMVTNKDATSAHLMYISAFVPERVATDQFDVASERDIALTDRWWERVGDLNKLIDKKFLPSPRIKSPDGRFSAELRDRRVTLYDPAGTELWTVPSNAALEVMWTPAGRLVAWGSGIAQLDVATGAILERQCGWRFGKWEQTAEGFGSAGLCEAP